MGETEVKENGPAVVDDTDVVGFDVAVSEAGPVQRRQRIGRLPAIHSADGTSSR